MSRNALIILAMLVVGCGGDPESFDRGQPKPEYADAVKQAAEAGIMVTCDNDGEVTFLDFHAHPDPATAVSFIKSFPNLKMLNFSSSNLTDADMEPIASAQQLEELGLHGTQITDAGLQHLSGLKNLRQLNLTDTAVGDAGLAHLQDVKSLVRIDLQNTQVTDAGLHHLEVLPNLVYVVLSNSPVSQEGVTQLREQLPDAEILCEEIVDFSDSPMLTDDQLPD